MDEIDKKKFGSNFSLFDVEELKIESEFICKKNYEEENCEKSKKETNLDSFENFEKNEFSEKYSTTLSSLVNLKEDLLNTLQTFHDEFEFKFDNQIINLLNYLVCKTFTNK